MTRIPFCIFFLFPSSLYAYYLLLVLFHCLVRHEISWLIMSFLSCTPQATTSVTGTVSPYYIVLSHYFFLLCAVHFRL